MFSARRAVHTLVEKVLIMGDVVSECSHVFGLPKNTACWVFDGVQDVLLLAQPPEALSDIIQPLGGSSFGSIDGCQIGWPVGVRICAQHWEVIPPFSADEPGAVCSSATRWGKVNVYAGLLLDNLLDEF